MQVNQHKTPFYQFDRMLTKMLSEASKLSVCLSDVLLSIPVNSYGHVRTLPPFYGIFPKKI